jgi:hypothetical protein
MNPVASGELRHMEKFSEATKEHLLIKPFPTTCGTSKGVC